MDKSSALSIWFIDLIDRRRALWNENWILFDWHASHCSLLCIYFCTADQRVHLLLMTMRATFRTFPKFQRPCKNMPQSGLHVSEWNIQRLWLPTGKLWRPTIYVWDLPTFVLFIKSTSSAPEAQNRIDQKPPFLCSPFLVIQPVSLWPQRWIWHPSEVSQDLEWCPQCESSHPFLEIMGDILFPVIEPPQTHDPNSGEDISALGSTLR